MTSPKRLFLSFVSDWSIYSNPARSFLEYFQKSNLPFQLIDFPSNLYRTSERLTEDYQSFTARWRLPDGTVHPVVFSFIPESNEINTLVVELGDAKVAEYLVGKSAADTNIIWLSELMGAGGRIMDAYCALLSWEERPKQTTKPRREYGQLHLDSLPLMVWTSDFLSPELSNLKTDFWQAERQSDGAWLLIQRSLPSEDYDRSSSSLWTEQTQTQYFLVPDNLILPSGDFYIRNLEGKIINVDATAVVEFAIGPDEVKLHLEDRVRQTIEQSSNLFSNWLTASLEENLKQPSSPIVLSERSLSEIISDLMGMTVEEAENQPEAVREGFKNLLVQFKETIDWSLSGDLTQLEIARSRMKKVRDILAAHGIDTGDILEKLPDNLRRISMQPNQNLQKSIDSVRELSNLLEKYSGDPREQKLELGKLVESVVNTYKKLSGQETLEQTEALQEQEYASRAREAIKQSMEQNPMPSFKLEDLWPED